MNFILFSVFYLLHSAEADICVASKERSSRDINAIFGYVMIHDTPILQSIHKTICVDESGVLFLDYNSTVFNYFNMSIDVDSCNKICSAFVCGHQTVHNPCRCSNIIATELVRFIEACHGGKRCSNHTGIIAPIFCPFKEKLQREFCQVDTNVTCSANKTRSFHGEFECFLQNEDFCLFLFVNIRIFATIVAVLFIYVNYIFIYYSVS